VNKLKEKVHTVKHKIHYSDYVHGQLEGENKGVRPPQNTRKSNWTRTSPFDLN